MRWGRRYYLAVFVNEAGIDEMCAANASRWVLSCRSTTEYKLTFGIQAMCIFAADVVMDADPAFPSAAYFLTIATKSLDLTFTVHHDPIPPIVLEYQSLSLPSLRPELPGMFDCNLDFAYIYLRCSSV